MRVQLPNAGIQKAAIARLLEEAVKFHAKGELGRAEPIYRRVLADQPNNFDAKRLLGTLLHRTGHFSESVALLSEALKINWRDETVHVNLGNVLLDIGSYPEAVQSFDKAIKLNRTIAEAYYGRGIAQTALKQLEEAIDSFNRAISIRPDYSLAIENRGVALWGLRRTEEALRNFDAAIELNPKNADAHNNRGAILELLNRHEDALTAYANAISIKPDFVMAITNLAGAFGELGHHSPAVAALDNALAIAPNNADAKLTRGSFQLLHGVLPDGWSGYEERLRVANAVVRRPLDEVADWSGENISGKRVLIYEEQGIGDILQFVRYVPEIIAAGGNVTLYVRSNLHKLLESLSGDFRIVDEIPSETFDFQCAVMSLPFAFQTTLYTIPARIPYLHAEEERVRQWAKHIGEKGFRVGIAWQGNPNHKIDAGRSFPLKFLQGISEIPGVRLISIQKTYGLEQLVDLPAGMVVETLGDTFDIGQDALLDTAAVMSSLDLVITSDTSIAHLAGALGRPVWIALKLIPNWRWLLERSDSPWYPTARLYRQTVRGDWENVFLRMEADLRSAIVSPEK